jgi:hypothetical protein
MKNQLLRHLLATLAYRFQKCIQGAPEGFGTFQAGADVRSPAEIVNHMTHLFYYVESVLKDQERRPAPESPDMSGEVVQFHDGLKLIDDLLVEMTIPPATACMLLQGPLSDAMTHVGQLAMLRRLAGKSIPGESFVRARIHIGQVSSDQPLSFRTG